MNTFHLYIITPNNDTLLTRRLSREKFFENVSVVCRTSFPGGLIVCLRMRFISFKLIALVFVGLFRSEKVQIEYGKYVGIVRKSRTGGIAKEMIILSRPELLVRETCNNALGHR